MSFSTYAKQSWTNGSGGGTALSGTRLGHLEDGLAAASTSFNVLAYGATGDGATNDVVAMQAALDAGAGGTVVIPPGTYNILGALRVSANTTIYAYGATVRQGTAGGLLYNFKTGDSNAGYTGRGGITVLGGTWDANASDGTTGVVTGGYDAFYFAHATGVTVRDATITNVSTAHAIDLTGCDRVRIVNCNFLGYRDNSSDQSSQFREAIQVDLASATSNLPLNDNTTERDVLVTGCTVGPSSRLGSFGRFIGSHGTDLVAPAIVRHTDIRVIGNRIVSTLQEGIRAEAWTRAVIADNVIVTPGLAGIVVTTVANTPVDSIVVEGNLIESPGGSAIAVLGLSTAAITEVVISGNTARTSVGSAITAAYAPGVRIIGNIIKSATSGGVSVTLSDNATVGQNTVRSTSSIGIYMAGCAGGSVSANMIDTTGSYGVNLDAISGVNDTDCVVTGNVIRASTTAGVRLSAGALGTTVTANQIRKGSGTTAGGVSVAATATGAVVVGNDLSGNAWTAAAAVAISTGAATKVDYAGGTTVPGHNLI